jgi:hypothetical protein
MFVPAQDLNKKGEYIREPPSICFHPKYADGDRFNKGKQKMALLHKSSMLLRERQS